MVTHEGLGGIDEHNSKQLHDVGVTKKVANIQFLLSVLSLDIYQNKTKITLDGKPQ